MPDDKPNTTIPRLDWIENKWRRFRTARQEYDLQIERDWPAIVPEALKKWAGGSGIQSPDLEWASAEFVKIRTMNPTKIDAVSQEKGPVAEREVEEKRIWIAASWAKQNKNRQLDKAAFQSMVDYGISAERKLWVAPEEPDEEDKDFYGDEKDADKRKKMRGDWLRQPERQHPFSTAPVNPVEVMFWPPDPRAFTEVWQKSEVSLPDAYDGIRNDKGEYPSLDAEERLTWLSASEPSPEYGGTASDAGGQVIQYCVHEWKDRKTKQWKQCEYVQGGQSEYEKVKERVIPFGRSSYFFTPSGEERPRSRDPHLRFRGVMYRLYVLYNDVNFIESVLAALALKKISDQDVYLNVATASPEALAWFESIGGQYEGAGANRRVKLERPNKETNEVMFAPGKLEVWPNDDTLEKMERSLDRRWRDIQKHLPNQILTGSDPQTAREATGTAWVGMRQAAALPVGADLGERDSTIREMLEAELQALQYWGKRAPTGRSLEWPVTTTGDEPLLKDRPDPGREIVMTPEKAARRASITVFTKHEWKDEESNREDRAMIKMARGATTPPQFIREMGYPDAQKQLEELAKYKFAADLALLNAPAKKLMLMQAWTALTKVNLPALMALGETPEQQTSGGSLPQSTNGNAPLPQEREPTIKMPESGGPGGGSGPMAGVGGLG